MSPPIQAYDPNSPSTQVSVALTAIGMITTPGIVLLTAQSSPAVGLKGYLQTPDATSEIPITGLPAGSAARPSFITGFSKSPFVADEQGFLVGDLTGAVHQLRYDAIPGRLTYTQSLTSELMTDSSISQLAVGDLDGDDLNDIVLAAPGKLRLFARRQGGFIPVGAVDGAPAQPAGVAIGDYYGAGSSVVIVVDGALSSCTAIPGKWCNRVFLYAIQGPGIVPVVAE
jgi:hypothetical protein